MNDEKESIIAFTGLDLNLVPLLIVLCLQQCVYMYIGLRVSMIHIAHSQIMVLHERNDTIFSQGSWKKMIIGSFPNSHSRPALNFIPCPRGLEGQN